MLNELLGAAFSFEINFTSLPINIMHRTRIGIEEMDEVCCPQGTKLEPSLTQKQK